jgi:multiple sugar transport system substrate-binding protein
MELGWRQVLPYLSRGAVGMVLMGGFAVLQFPAAVRADLGFFPFPRLHGRQAQVENAPLDVLVQPAACAQPQAAQAFLRHVAQARLLQTLNASMGLLPPLQQAPLAQDPLSRAAAALLADTPQSTQYFDRDSPATFSGPALALLQDFAQRPSQPLAALQNKLEHLRLRAVALSGAA